MDVPIKLFMRLIYVCDFTYNELLQLTDSEGLLRDLGKAVKQFASKVQSNLPLIGLLSRLTSPAGGVGTNELVSCMADH